MKYLISLMLMFNFLYSEEKMNFNDFANFTNFNKTEIDKCIDQSSKEHSVPKLIIKSIIDVENSKYLNYAINCNNNIVDYSKSIKQNYQNYKKCNNNMDVGVMQINYRVWKKEYPNITISLLLNPCVNIELGTRILNSHYNETGDWIKSIGYYHSRTTKHLKKYKKLVISKILAKK